MRYNTSATQAYDLLQKGQAVLIDVREAEEFKQEHIAYALSVPLSQFEESLVQLQIPEDKAIIFQCLKGKRGEMACARVQGIEKFKNDILNIEGGIDGWKEAHLPIVQSQPTAGVKIPVQRQVLMIMGSLIATLILIGGSASYIAAVFALALAFSGLTGWCGLAMMLQKMPWNKS